jgi:high-affinity K+ transport system ATPase subunit B
MVDLDSNPMLIEIVAIGKQLLITRGALTFSIANDVAKYFTSFPPCSGYTSLVSLTSWVYTTRRVLCRPP